MKNEGFAFLNLLAYEINCCDYPKIGIVHNMMLESNARISYYVGEPTFKVASHNSFKDDLAQIHGRVLMLSSKYKLKSKK